jgi:hypothetical protein
LMIAVSGYPLYMGSLWQVIVPWSALTVFSSFPSIC